MTPRAPSPGRLLDAGTRVWVRVTGRRVDLRSTAWLDGPTGDVDRVGDRWSDREVARAGGRYAADGPGAGLLPAVAVLDAPGFAAEDLHPLVREFYEQSSPAGWSSWPFPSGRSRSPTA